MIVNIRRMRIEDVQAVYLIDCMSLPTPWSEAAFRHELETPHSRPWVAEVTLPADSPPLVYHSPLPLPVSDLVRQPGEQAIIGMLVLWMIVDEAHIATLAVHPRFRQQGIGKELVRTALENAADEGALYALLEVRSRNIAAQNLYRQFGFEIVGRRPHYYIDNGEDALLMTLSGLARYRSKVESYRVLRNSLNQS